MLLTAPNVFTTAFLTLIFAWKQPVTVVIPNFATVYTVDYGARAAARRIVSGLTAGALTRKLIADSQGFGGVIAPVGLYNDDANHTGVRPPDETPGEVKMKAKVTEAGVLIPREMLQDMPGQKVEIRKEPGRLLVLPADDPILSFGEDPLDDQVTDASIDLDRYLHGSHESGS